MADIQVEPRAGREAAIRLFVSEAPLNLCLLDLQGRIEAVSPMLQAVYQVTPDELIGRTVFELAPSAVGGLAKILQVLDVGYPQRVLIDHSMALGRRTHRFRSEASYCLNDDGVVAGYLLMLREITSQHDVGPAPAGAGASVTAVADAVNAATSRFLTNISHEIRTPLNGVLGMAQAMACDTLSEDQRDRLDVIRQSGEVLRTLLDDLLDLSRIEAGKFELETKEFDLAMTVQGACAAFQAVADLKGLTLSVSLDDQLGACRGDQIRLRQVIGHLVANALKFTDHGEVRIDAARTGDNVRFTVSDTGVGIAAEAMETLFERFSQADPSTTRRFGGAGLGLAICRDLVTLMGGDIRAEASPAGGACFIFTLPLPREVAVDRLPQAAAPTTAPTAPAGLRVLAAEDNPVNQTVLRTLLQMAGVDAVFVSDGAAAVQAWSREPWDLILMDVQMPVMDGPTASAIIRGREAASGRPATPIIAVTANALAHQVADYFARGMNAVVPKPIVVETLFGAIDDALARPAGQGAPREASRAAASTI